MRTKKWSELSPRTRQFIVVTGAIEGALKVVALVDLARRPAEDVRGSKAGWAASIVLINSVGLVPIGYFVFGRKPAEPKAVETASFTSGAEVAD